MFFFSSRRRHTRFSRDWSSDACFPISQVKVVPVNHIGRHIAIDIGIGIRQPVVYLFIAAFYTQVIGVLFFGLKKCRRSEERRVGKECRSGWSPHLEKQEEECRRKGCGE